MLAWPSASCNDRGSVVGGDTPVHREMGEKPRNIPYSHLTGMPKSMKPNKLSIPPHVGLLRPVAHALRSYGSSQRSFQLAFQIHGSQMFFCTVLCFYSRFGTTSPESVGLGHEPTKNCGFPPSTHN
jgi:hypothetical protein